ncbi:TlpA family protein disulfide reductase [Aureivirga marina]|uniref:TlpA family protein disulfide reductase n=1 Tax=Aureivirga marina TaxID=1182451 RepID=UPI001E52ED4F|nr:TlpA disulfide reductase family protein [Aureivirga marina]
MKKIILFAFFIAFTSYMSAQNSLPQISLKNLKGETVDIKSLEKDGLVMINFWATWCGPCVKELNALSEEYDEIVEDTKVKIVAVSIDDARTAPRVNAFVNGKGWPFDVLLDSNSDLKRAMNVGNVPHVFIIKNGKIVYSHSGYTEGAEYELIEKLEELSKS